MSFINNEIMSEINKNYEEIEIKIYAKKETERKIS